jgi:hypothetical protein
MNNLEVVYVGVLPANQISFKHIADGVNNERRTMLHVTPESLLTSYVSGFSTVIIDKANNDTPVGHIRFIPLITQELKSKINFPTALPELWEIGTGLIDNSDGYRGRGLYRMIRNAHVGRFQSDLNNGSLVAIGTTKSLKILHTLHQAQNKYGIEGIILRHTDLPFIAAFTCVCTEDFGKGYQCGINACDKRIQSDQLPMTSTNNNLLDQSNLNAIMGIISLNGNSDTIPCTMYLQGKKDAILGMEAKLKKQFGTPENLVLQLRDPTIDYYGELKTN